MKNQLATIIGVLLQRLGVDEVEISAKEYDSVQKDKHYIGLEAKRSNGGNIIVRRTVREDYSDEEILLHKLENLIDGLKNSKQS